MNKRAATLAGSIAVALLLLGGILLLDRLGGGEPGTTAAPGQRHLTASGDLPGFDPQGVDETGGIKPGEVEQYRFEQINSHGQLVQFFGDRLDPGPGGLIEVERPISRVHLVAQQRILQVTADEGTFLAPEDRPQSGELVGNVVVQLFDSRGSGPVSIEPDSPHLELQVTLPRARFDLDLGQLTSEDHVVVTGPRLQFEGTGLQLSYNAMRNRIDRLVIEKGKRLWFKHQGSTDDAAVADAGVVADDALADDARDADNGDTGDEGDAERLVYHATFERNVEVTSPDAVINADQLEVLFSLGAADQSVAISRAPAARESHAGWPGAGLARTGSLLQSAGLTRLITGPAKLAATGSYVPAWARVIAAGVLAQSAGERDVFAPAASRALDMQPSADAVLITWEGRLVVLPQPNPPEGLAGGDDVFVSLTGAPLTVRTTDEQVITGGTLTYASGLDVMTIDAIGEDQPLTIASPQLGVLTGQHFVLNQTAARGQLTGPGKLVASSPKDGSAAGESLPGSQGLADMTLHFSKQVDLDLIPATVAERAEAGEEAGDDTAARLAGIRSARFVGDVKVEHPRFDMASDTLDVELDDQQRPATVRQIIAHGNASARTRETEAAPASSITGQSLTLDLQPNAAGELEPVKLTAAGGVVARQPDRVLLTGRLEADLASQAAGEDGETALLVKQVRTTQGVEAKLEDQNIDVYATRLIADPATNQIDLFGSEGKPARIDRPDGTLTAMHLVLLADSETIIVPGAGTAEFYPEPDDVAQADRDAQAGDDRLRITWSQSMKFDNTGNVARFVGDIKAQATDATQRTTLSSGELQLNFVPERDAVSLQKVNHDDPQKIARSIRTITAKNDVSFTSESYEDQLDGKLQTRLSVKGPQLRFEGASEQVHVLGQGTMLMEDYRPEKPDDEAPQQPQQANQSQLHKLSGRGTTAFRWSDSLMLDAKNNDMKIEGNVGMAHRAAGQQKLSQLYADRFIADLQETGGLGAWMSSEAPKPRLSAAYADGRVRVELDKREITTDHLDYRAADQMLRMRADPPNVTTITTEGENAPIVAQEIRYDLQRGRAEIEKMGATRAPMR